MAVVWRRRRPEPVLEPYDEATGNVRVTPGIARPRLPADAFPDEPGAGWGIRDAAGELVQCGLPSRAAALREIGLVALRGRNAPYEVIDPHGHPSGDRLA